MAYSELIKSFNHIRDYIREFYVYGFRHRSEIGKKSARSYDNERRRMESWLGDYMEAKQDTDGKRVYLSFDSRVIAHNPLYRPFKAKSFTDKDIQFHFFMLDLLEDAEEGMTVREIIEALEERYFKKFTSDSMEESTIRKKIKEYVDLGLLQKSLVGREYFYTKTRDSLDLSLWREAVSFYSEAAPLGVIGDYLLDQYDCTEQYFRFKHHHMIRAIESEVLCVLLEAISSQTDVILEVYNRQVEIIPFKIYVSVRYGRQYMLGWLENKSRFEIYRLDRIVSVSKGERGYDLEPLQDAYIEMKSHLWGVVFNSNGRLEHVECILEILPYQKYVLARLMREKRCASVEALEENRYLLTADVYSAKEMVPWLRTFIGRIVDFRCSDKQLEKHFWRDIQYMKELYHLDVERNECRMKPVIRRMDTSLASQTFVEIRNSHSLKKEKAIGLFHEIYGTYYQVVAELIHRSLNHSLRDDEMYSIISERGFDESILELPDKLKNNWHFLGKDKTTLLHHSPKMPLTILQKRWLKSLLSDSKIRLFNTEHPLNDVGLEDVKPLFSSESFVYFDRDGDGDPFEDEAYIQHFHIILKALEQKSLLKIIYKSNKNHQMCYICLPHLLEYSAKDEKFRLQASSYRDGDSMSGKMAMTFNLTGMIDCQLLEDDWMKQKLKFDDEDNEWHILKKDVLIQVLDYRNALERVLLHFSSFQKETKKIDEKCYEIRLFYDSRDETEILIRLLAFGPILKVLEPSSLINQMKARLQSQAIMVSSDD